MNQKLSAPLMKGLTLEQIHEKSLAHKKALKDKKQQEAKVQTKPEPPVVLPREPPGTPTPKPQQSQARVTRQQKPAKEQQPVQNQQASKKEVGDAELRAKVITALKGQGLPTPDSLVDRLSGILGRDGDAAFNRALKEITNMQGTFSGSGLTLTVKGTAVTGTFFEQTVQQLSNATSITIVADGAAKGWIDTAAGTITFDLRMVVNGGGQTQQLTQKFVGMFSGKGYQGHIAGDDEAKWTVSR